MKLGTRLWRDRLVTCFYCGKEELLPFDCPRCGRSFCVEHRVPETHQCPGLTLGRAIPTRREEDLSIPQTYPRTYWLHTSVSEGLHLVAAIATVFLIEGLRIVYFYGLHSETYSVLSMIILATAASFLLHETAHKLMAQYHGMWEEFRIDRLGIGMSLVTAIPFVPLKILAPGRMIILGRRGTTRTIGSVAMAGILANLVLAAAFIAAYPSNSLLFYGAVLNSDLAFFNMLPFGVLDGKKIRDWSPRVWLLLLVATMSLWIYLWLL